MFERLAGRVEAAAGETVRRRVDEVAAAFWAELPGVSVEVADGEVVVRGRGLMRRWLNQAGLRMIGTGR